MELVYKTDRGLLFKGDCIPVLEKFALDNRKVDMILADLPYGTTQNKWDSPIDLKWLWKLYDNLITDNGAVVLTAQLPFDKALGMSNLNMWEQKEIKLKLRYEWIWRKAHATGHLNVNKMPMKNHENVMVFYKHLPTYNPQFTEGEPYTTIAKAENTSSNYGKQTGWETINEGTRHPVTVLDFPHDTSRLHPTQKPLALFEYMINTYTNEGDIVLDNVMGSGTTAVACENLNRRWIGIEKKSKYIDIIIKRLKENENI